MLELASRNRRSPRNQAHFRLGASCLGGEHPNLSLRWVPLRLTEDEHWHFALHVVLNANRYKKGIDAIIA